MSHLSFDVIKYSHCGPVPVRLREIIADPVTRLFIQESFSTRDVSDHIVTVHNSTVCSGGSEAAIHHYMGKADDLTNRLTYSAQAERHVAELYALLLRHRRYVDIWEPFAPDEVAALTPYLRGVSLSEKMATARLPTAQFVRFFAEAHATRNPLRKLAKIRDRRIADRAVEVVGRGTPEKLLGNLPKIRVTFLYGGNHDFEKLLPREWDVSVNRLANFLPFEHWARAEEQLNQNILDRGTIIKAAYQDYFVTAFANTDCFWDGECLDYATWMVAGHFVEEFFSRLAGDLSEIRAIAMQAESEAGFVAGVTRFCRSLGIPTDKSVLLDLALRLHQERGSVVSGAS
jgi:hypothetical protein